MSDTNLQVIVKTLPENIPVPEDFALVEGAMPEPGPGQVLVQTMYLSLDPYMGSALKGRHITAPVAAGGVMPGETIGKILKSNNPDFAEGEIVYSRGGWQSYSVANDPAHLTPYVLATANAAQKIPAFPGIPTSSYLGVMGMPGLTAYAATAFLSELKPGQTFATGAASGAVGSAAGQLARIMGARAVGIAGSDEKCRAAVERFGFDACVNYKKEGWADALKAACPDGVDCFLDSSGGKILQTVLFQLALHARVILMGMMDQYNSPVPLPGPNLGMVMAKRATVKGLIVYDFYDRMAEYRKYAAQWIAEGRLKNMEDLTDGLAGAPAAFSRLMHGNNLGKVIVKVAGG
jgi:NADPH-dependent curcumin reductase CurA